ncbi:MAG: putative membrane-spanning protein [Firmicutes bacterium]|nr:putative membrane-spanning protein [Bacillota bacterium]MDI6705387.1 hypothetical protein [Bacillota bacterium]
MKPKENSGKKQSNRWVILITIWTFILALTFSFLSETVVRNLQLTVAFLILAIIVLTGIFFDIIGIAVAASDDKSLNGMAAQKIPGAREAVMLHKNAGAVSNFCNDVIGDICGIVSGAAGAVIVLRFIVLYPAIKAATLGILFSSVTAAVTVGGKALGKNIAIEKADEITYEAGRFLNFINSKTGLTLMNFDKNSRKR